MDKRFLHRMVLALLFAALFATLACLVTLPFFVRTWLGVLGDTYSPSPDYQVFMTMFVISVGLCASYILFELIRVFRTLEREPFDMRNVRSLKRIGICGVGVAMLFAVKAVFFITPLTVICAFVLFICGLFAVVLSHVFADAVMYKQDHDLTI